MLGRRGQFHPDFNARRIDIELFFSLFDQLRTEGNEIIIYTILSICIAIKT